MAKAVNKVTGVTVAADEAVIRRLGPGWVLQADEKEPAPKRAPRGKKTK